MSIDVGRWRRTLDPVADPLVALVVLLLCLEPLIDLRGQPAACGCRGTPWWSWTLVIAGALPLVARRRWPFASSLLAGGATAAYGITDLPDAQVPYVALVALYSVAAHATRRRAYIAAGIAAVSIPAAILAGGDGTAQDYAITVLLCATAWLLGNDSRNRRDRAAELEERARQLERTRTAEAQRAVVEERNRIARELHDVVAHHVTMMVVQAEAGPVVVGSEPERAAQAFDDIAAAGKHALRDMRQLLGVLREGDQGRAPVAGLDRLPALVADVRRAGLDADLVVTGEPRDLPSAVELSAYRVVQESLTNALRHSDGAHVGVHIAYGADQLSLDVIDDGGGGESRVPGTGTGLLAMRERVDLVGGRLEAGPVPERGWAVRARIPLPTAEAL